MNTTTSWITDRCESCENDEHFACHMGEYDPATDSWDGCACPNFSHF